MLHSPFDLRVLAFALASAAAAGAADDAKDNASNGASRPALRMAMMFGTLVVALAGAAAAFAQPGTDPSLMRRYGGVLAAQCGDYLRPQIKVLGDTLVVQDAGKAVLTGRNVRAAPAHFGA